MSTTKTQVMVPGILVALKTSVRGGVTYERTDLEQEDEEGKETRWETRRFMDDPAERKRASEVASKAAGLVSKLCTRTSFGLLCRLDNEEALDAAVREMRSMVSDWNAKAVHSFVSVSAIKGRIADNDEEAIAAIVEEAKELLAEMDKGLSDRDVKAIRDAANRAKRLSKMMTDETSVQINEALTAAREAAKAIVKSSGEIDTRITDVIIEVEAEAFRKERFDFIEVADAVVESLPSINLQRAAELEVVENEVA